MSLSRKTAAMVHTLMLAGAVVLPVTTMVIAASPRTWTSTSGSTVQAEFVGRKGSAVILRDANGQSLRIPYSRLSQQDRDYILSVAPVGFQFGRPEPLQVPGGYVRGYSTELAPMDLVMHAVPELGDIDGDGRAELLLLGKIAGASPLVVDPVHGRWPPQYAKPEFLNDANGTPLKLPGGG